MNTVIDELKALVTTGETGKIRAAALLYRVQKEELYKPMGFATMAAFLPYLGQELEPLGWGSVSALKRALAWYKTYIKLLEIDERQALAASSHLYSLLRVAQVTRDGGYVEDDNVKVGKLTAIVFEDCARLVTWAVNLPNTLVVNGLEGDRLTAELGKEGLIPAAESYKAIMGCSFNIKPKGWTLNDTNLLVDTVRDARVEDTSPVRRVWYVQQVEDAIVKVRHIDFMKLDAVVSTLPIEAIVLADDLPKMVGKDTVEYV